MSYIIAYFCVVLAKLQFFGVGLLVKMIGQSASKSLHKLIFRSGQCMKKRTSFFCNHGKKNSSMYTKLIRLAIKNARFKKVAHSLFDLEFYMAPLIRLFLYFFSFLTLFVIFLRQFLHIFLWMRFSVCNGKNKKKILVKKKIFQTNRL